MRRARRWTIDQLRAAVAASKSYEETLRKLGLRGNHAAIKRCIAEEQISTTHFTASASGWNRVTKHAWTRRFSPEKLREAVARSTSVRGAIGALGLVECGGNYQSFWRYVREQQLSTAHFKGRAWNKGLKVTQARGRTLTEMLQAGTTVNSTSSENGSFAKG